MRRCMEWPATFERSGTVTIVKGGDLGRTTFKEVQTSNFQL